ncbi:MAG: hypothetical protein V1922_02395 [bacterium]
MSKKVFAHYLFLSVVSFGIIAGFVYFFQQYHSPSTKAQENTLTIKIKLQGERYPQATASSTIVFYSAQGMVKEFKNVIFSYQADKTFEGIITFDPNFNYNALYALYIKPNNYFGKLFCSEIINGKNCTSPQFIFKQNVNVIDLSNQFFYGGDINPANGKVDAYDVSKILANLGTSHDFSTDINNDAITNSIDYLLALYSLSNNFSDDTIPFITTMPTSTQTGNVIVTPMPTNTVAPIQTPIGVCHTIPGSVAKSMCGVPEQNVSATAEFGSCAGAQSTNPMCTTITSKGKCTCPNGAVCVCQLEDAATQTIECTNGGKMEIVQCTH